MCPVLVRLAGPNFQNYESAALIQIILKSIEDVTSANRRIQLKGRTTELLRINYDPSSEHFSSIKSRMVHLLCHQPVDYEALETLLCPLVASNPRAFFNVDPSTLRNTKQLTEEDGYNSWIWGLSGIKKFKPKTGRRSEEMTAGVLQAVRDRCLKAYPRSALLRNPRELQSLPHHDLQHILDWSLYEKQTGLGVKLMECFNDLSLSPDDQEDLIERVLFRYKRANPKEMYGQDGAVEKDGAVVNRVDVDSINRFKDQSDSEDDGGVKL